MAKLRGKSDQGETEQMREVRARLPSAPCRQRDHQFSRVKPATPQYLAPLWETPLPVLPGARSRRSTVFVHGYGIKAAGSVGLALSFPFFLSPLFRAALFTPPSLTLETMKFSGVQRICAEFPLEEHIVLGLAGIKITIII